VAAQPDHSRAALARFIEFVVDKGLAHPSTAQGWRVATSKVLADLSPAESEDVRRIDVDATFRAFLNRNPGRLAPASVGEYRRRVGRAIEEFVRWVESPGDYRPRAAAYAARQENRPKARPRLADAPPATRMIGARRDDGGMALEYPIRPGQFASVVIPRDLTVEEARRMGAFLVTLAVDFRPGVGGDLPS
jgi:hypothetical protein